MKVSVIIPTYNAEPYIKKLLEMLSYQTQKIDEIIVIDSSSSDNTVKIAKNFGARIIVIPKNEFDHGGTRTKAAKLATGDILVYLTQDAIPADRNSIKNLVNIFKNEEIGAAFGRQIPYKNTNLFGKHLRYFNYPNKSYIRTYKDKQKYGLKAAFLSDSFAAYRKNVLKEIGWFKNGLILGEDIYASARILKAGYKIAYIAEASVYHSHSYTIWREFKRYFDIGVFYRCENWILDEFGKPEREGIKYLKSEWRYILQNKAFFLLPVFILRNILKYIGYKGGYNYNKIPAVIIKRLSMHPHWWERRK